MTAPDPGLADLIAAHHPSGHYMATNEIRCGCGWLGPASDWPAHVALVVEQHTNGRITELEERIAELEQKGSWEYEYGVVAEAFGGDPEASPTLEAALHVRDNATTIYKAWTKGEPVTIVCRRPFGPWMPAALEGEQQ
ncbi:hypothetical protein [Rhodococcus erythropolis]|uniref:hypothetical protein n=1 Tax=Rhodococcus erythropolis TaxID=1833 RepID=UPI0022262C47|nr:hypothetical protein [Rhodococcus erythropolis]MCW2300713.1 hypothetical protein [Rhodococcus erythropolis]